jgi:transmembrane sensor
MTGAKDRSDERRDDIDDVVALWLAKEDRGLSASEREELDELLNTSLPHRIAYLSIKSVWRRADCLATLNEFDIWGWITSLFRINLSRYSVAVTAVVALLLCVGGGYYCHSAAPRGTFRTSVGQHENFRLSDGSLVELNTNTRMHAKMTGRSRTVTLEHGEAYFDVVHDSKRPFVVLAGNHRIVDLGTKFSVRHYGNSIKVTVSEGRVRVDVVTPQHANAATPILAKKDDIVVAEDDEILVASETRQQIEDDLRWRIGVLVFNQEPLGSIAEEFNRYNKKKIVVEGDARNFRICGSFRTENVDVFTRLIKSGFGLKVEDRGEKYVISK